MKKLSVLLLIFAAPVISNAQNNIPSAEIQIKTAVLSAPANKRDSAAVYGYSATGEWTLLRKGLNEMICLADDPSQPGFNVSCYHVDLEPFMQRGRELKKLKKSGQEIFDTREEEAKEGKLQLPKHPASLFVYSAKEEDYNRQTGEVKNGYLRSVVYIPYATAESTGLPLKPEAPGMPWIMHPGTHGAHIMINPAKAN
jgi:hypothetical protein